MKTRWIIPLVVLFALAAAPMGFTQTGASERDAVVNSFKEFARDYMQKWNAKNTPIQMLSVERGNSKTKFLWTRIYDDPVENYDIDVKATDSLVSPYIGILKFTSVGHGNGPHTSREAAEKDQKFQVVSSAERLEFNYQDGKWVAKE